MGNFIRLKYINVSPDRQDENIKSTFSGQSGVSTFLFIKLKNVSGRQPFADAHMDIDFYYSHIAIKDVTSCILAHLKSSRNLKCKTKLLLLYLNGLWYKLYKIGINGKMLKIIKDMYNQVKACVRGCNSYSDFLN